MNYHVEYTKKVDKILSKMDHSIRRLVLAWIEKNLEGCDNPRLYGKPLTGDRTDQWRYRIGDYRVLAEIDDGTVTILVLKIGNRKDIYH